MSDGASNVLTVAPLSPAESTIRITSRDLDHDDRHHVLVPVVPAATDPARREQLLAAVLELHPEARCRSYADGTASFLTRTHLIVATLAGSRTAPALADAGQAPLFAA